MALVNILLVCRRRRYRLFFRFSRRRISAFESVPGVVLRAMTLINMLLVHRRRRYRFS
jgi:hypothetical protein